MSFDKLCEKSKTGAGTVESAVRERCLETDAAEAIIRLYWRLTYTEKVVGLMGRLRMARLRVWLDTDHDFQEAEHARHTDGAVCSAVFGEGMRADVDVTPDAQTRRLFRPMLTLPIGYKTKYNIRVNDVSTGFSWTASDSEWSDRSGRTEGSLGEGKWMIDYHRAYHGDYKRDSWIDRSDGIKIKIRYYYKVPVRVFALIKSHRHAHDVDSNNLHTCCEHCASEMGAETLCYSCSKTPDWYGIF